MSKNCFSFSLFSSLSLSYCQQLGIFFSYQELKGEKLVKARMKHIFYSFLEFCLVLSLFTSYFLALFFLLGSLSLFLCLPLLPFPFSYFSVYLIFLAPILLLNSSFSLSFISSRFSLSFLPSICYLLFSPSLLCLLCFSRLPSRVLISCLQSDSSRVEREREKDEVDSHSFTDTRISLKIPPFSLSLRDVMIAEH